MRFRAVSRATTVPKWTMKDMAPVLRPKVLKAAELNPVTPGRCPGSAAAEVCRPRRGEFQPIFLTGGRTNHGRFTRPAEAL